MQCHSRLPASLHELPFVVCVPIASLSSTQFARPSGVRQYPSGNHGSFRAAHRRSCYRADPVGVICHPSRPQGYRLDLRLYLHGIPHPRLTVAYPIVKEQPSLWLAPSWAVRVSPRGSHSCFRITRSSVIRGCSCHIRRTEHPCQKMQTVHPPTARTPDLPKVQPIFARFLGRLKR